ncbi:MAG: DUF5906 domain-containing protein [Verrucomicrobiae bacterium]
MDDNISLPPVPTVLSCAILPSKTAKAYPIYYDHNKRIYHREDDHGNWIQIAENSVKRHLWVKYHVANKACPKVIDGIQSSNTIAYAGPLAGYKKGIYSFAGEKVLVTISPVFITPARGKWDTVDAILKGLLQDPNHDQLLYLKCWLKVGLESLYSGILRPGQALAIVGPKDCGKSFLQNILTQLFGGRSGIPYQYMTGQTQFNHDLFKAEHLMIEDNDPRTDIKSRRALGSAIKVFTVNEDQRCHAKGRDGVVLRPFWRLSITVNDEPENLLLLPPLDDSLADKMLILRAKRFPLPMPTVTNDQRTALQNQIKKELPCFVWHLFNEVIMPKDLESQRFGITHFHHPSLVAQLWDMDPEMRFLRMIEQFLGELPLWEGTSEELNSLLVKFGDTYEVRKVLSFPNACGTFLGRLGKKYPDRFQPLPGRADGKRHWKIVNESSIATIAAPTNHPTTTNDTYTCDDVVSVIEKDGGMVVEISEEQYLKLKSLIPSDSKMLVSVLVQKAAEFGYDEQLVRYWAANYAYVSYAGPDYAVSEDYLPF